MQIGILIFSAMVTLAIGGRVPDGFLPLPPLPVMYQVPTQPKTPTPVQPQTPTAQQKHTPKTKVPPKTTAAPITKKPTTVKTNKPVVTKAPLTQPSTRTSAQNCQFSFNVPNSNCKGGNSAVQQTLTSLRQQLAQTKQQHQAQTAAVQAQLSQLQSQQSSYVTKIADLQNEVQNLVAAFNSLNSGQGLSTSAPVIVPTPTASSANTFAMQQAVQNVQSNLRDAVKDFDTKIFNLSLILNDNQIQESKVHQTVESQLLKQASDISRLSQQISDLNRLLQQVQTNGTGSGSGGAMTSADVARLQTQIQQVSSDIHRYDNQQQARITNLTSTASSLQAAVNQQSTDIRNANNAARLTQTRLGVAEREIKSTHDAFGQFRQLYEPKILKIDQDVKDLANNISTVNNGVQQVTRTTLNLATKSAQNGRELASLKLQTNTLRNTTAKINTDLTAQKTEIDKIKRGLVNLKSTVPMQTLNDMNNIILQILSSTPVSRQLLTSLKNNLQTLQNRLQNLQIP